MALYSEKERTLLILINALGLYKSYPSGNDKVKQGLVYVKI